MQSLTKLKTLVVVAVGLSTHSLQAQSWIGSWGAAPQPAPSSLELNQQTLRQIVRISAGGSQFRLRFSNAFGSAPMTLDEVHVGLHSSGANVVLGTDHLVTFDGESAVTIASGQEVVSDPIQWTVSPLTELCVSIYFDSDINPSTNHVVASQTAYLSANGNFANYANFPVFKTLSDWVLISGVDVLSSKTSGSIVAIGDSITDGVCSENNGNGRWPDYLAARLDQASLNGNWGVLNEGIGSNKILTDTIYGDQPSVSALTRFQRDVLQRPGVRAVVILEGINDIGAIPTSADPGPVIESLKQGYLQMVSLAKTQGLKVYAGTLTPIGNAGMDSKNRRQIRDLLNQWMRSSNAFDGVVDFDQAIRDPNNPQAMLTQYDCGDHLHPNSRGYQAMGQAFNLQWFQTP